MASNYTETLKLCQWEGSDYFNHEEFNADNLKIENAYQALNSKFEEYDGKNTELEQKVNDVKMQLLKDETVDDSIESTLIVDISDINMTDYAHLVVECSWDKGNGNPTQAEIRLNGREQSGGSDYYKHIGSSSSVSSGVGSLYDYYNVFYIELMNPKRITVLNDSSAGGLFSAGISKLTPPEFNSLHFVASSSYKFTNFNIKVWGNKKW